MIDLLVDTLLRLITATERDSQPKSTLEYLGASALLYAIESWLMIEDGVLSHGRRGE